MKTTKNIEKFNNVFQSYYDYLYNNQEIEDALELSRLGDHFLRNRFHELALALADFRHDIISSDREAAAFALAILQSYHASPIHIKINKYQLLTVHPRPLRQLNRQPKPNYHSNY